MTPSILVPFTDGVQLSFVYTIGDKLATNVLWMLNRQPPTTQAQVDALASAAATYWAANMLALQADAVELTLVRAVSWDTPGVGVTGFVTPNLFGGVAEQAYGASVAIRLTFETSLGSGIYRNGNFFGGLPDSAVDVNALESGYVAALREAYIGVIDQAAGWGSFPAWRWVAVSLVDGGSLRTEMDIARIDHVHVFSPYVSPQRRRVRP